MEIPSLSGGQPFRDCVKIKRKDDNEPIKQPGILP